MTAPLVALAGPRWTVPEAESTAHTAVNVKRVKEEFFVANGTTPAWNDNGYIVYAVTPPVNITTGVGKELARITIVAYCGPVGKPLVLG